MTRPASGAALLVPAVFAQLGDLLGEQADRLNDMSGLFLPLRKVGASGSLRVLVLGRGLELLLDALESVVCGLVFRIRHARTVLPGAVA